MLTRSSKEFGSGCLANSSGLLKIEAVTGDGVNTEILDLNPEDEEELLDYENDISIDDEDDVQMVAETSNSVVKDAVASTSTASERQSDIIQQITGQLEEKLLNNPKIQNMMEKFFQSRFKDMMEQKGNQGKGFEKPVGNNPGSVERRIVSTHNNTAVSEGMVKSPSDITVYAPALQKKLTPQDGSRVVNQAMLNAELIYPGSNTNRVISDKNEQVKLVDNEALIANFVESIRLERRPTGKCWRGRQYE